jgi:hypothetical protein
LQVGGAAQWAWWRPVDGWPASLWVLQPYTGLRPEPLSRSHWRVAAPAQPATWQLRGVAGLGGGALVAVIQSGGGGIDGSGGRYGSTGGSPPWGLFPVLVGCDLRFCGTQMWARLVLPWWCGSCICSHTR